MISLERLCQSYFTGFNQIGQKNQGTKLGAVLRIASCVTLIIPVCILGVYGIASLYNRCCHKKEKNLGDSRVDNVAKQTLSSPVASLPSSSIPSSSIPPSSVLPANSFEEDSKMANASVQERAIKILEAEFTQVASTFQIECRYDQLMHRTPFSLKNNRTLKVVLGPIANPEKEKWHPYSIAHILCEKYASLMADEWNKLINDAKPYDECVKLFKEKAQKYREECVKNIQADIRSSQLFMETGGVQEEELERLTDRIFARSCDGLIEIESFQDCAPSQIMKAIFIGPINAAYALTLGREEFCAEIVALYEQNDCARPLSWSPEKLKTLGGNPHHFRHVISLLEREKIGGVRALLPNIPNYPPDMNCLHIDSVDGPVLFDKLMSEKERLMDLMDHAIASNEPVLIHCNAGMSRSVSTLMFYLIERCRWSPMKALSFIRQKRSIADPKAQIYSKLLQHAQQLGIDLEGEERLIKPLSQMGATTLLSDAFMELKIKQGPAIPPASQAIEALNDEASRASSSTEGQFRNSDNSHQNSGQDSTNSQSSSSSISIS